MRTIAALILIASLLGCADTDQLQHDRFPGLAREQVSQHGNITFVNGFHAGLELATKHKLPSLLYFTAEWCTFCQQMEIAAFSDSRVMKLADNFVCILVDADKEGQVCQQFDVEGFPTIVFVSPEGRLLHRVEGKQSASNLTLALHKAMERQSWLTSGESQLR